MAGNVPVFESVGAAFAYVRENTRFIAIVAAAGAAVVTLIGALAMAMPAVGLATTILTTVAQAFAYAALIAAAMFGAGEARARWAKDGGRVWSAMAIIGFFLFIVMFVASMVASIVLFAGPMADYVDELQAAGSDNAAVMRIMVQFLEANPLPVLFVTLFFSVIWMLLTSRLYLAAPASVDKQRILTFETWKWTKGAMLPITGARLLLLLPANIFVGAISHLIGRGFAINTFDPNTAEAVARANPAGYLAFVFIAAFVQLALYSALEAGLSSYLYRGLKPAETPPAA
jgi:hypothetical protein